jgi:hypothetical protein
VITDVMISQSPYDIPAATSFEGARLFAHHFESSAHTEAVKILCDSECGIVGNRIDVVFGIEPEQHVDRRAGGGETSNYQAQTEAKQNQSTLHAA